MSDTVVRPATRACVSCPKDQRSDARTGGHERVLLKLPLELASPCLNRIPVRVEQEIVFANRFGAHGDDGQ